MKPARLRQFLLASLIALSAGAAASAEDLLLVVNKSDSALAIVDPGSLEVVALVRTGAGPHEVAVSPDGRFAYVSDYGTRPDSTVTVVDLETRAPAATWSLGGNVAPHGIWASRDGESVWVTTEGSGTVLELDARSGEIARTWETGQQVSHMVVPLPDESKLYVANIGSGSATVIDRADDRVASTPTGAGAEGIDASPDGREIWVTNREANTISVIDPATDAVVESFPSGGQMPIRVKFTPDGARALVSNALSNQVAVFDAASRALVATIDVGAMPVGLLITPDGARAFVANTADDRITMIDMESLTVSGQLETGREPDGMAWASRGE